MSEEVKDQASAPTTAPGDATTRTADETTTAAEARAEAPSATEGDETGKSESKPSADDATAASPAEPTDKADKTSDTAEDVEQAASAGDEAAVNGASASAKKNQKRKSFGAVPEHKSKKLNRKKSMPNLNLDVEPGQYWYARMKGHPPWPAIVCDEEMLPESLIKNRPVSAARHDGTYREDFMEGGKNVRDRRYPVMFLGTNEFAWQVNTELAPLDLDDIKAAVEKDDQGKKTKSLWEAWKVAAEGHDLEHFKKMLSEHEKALQADREEKAEAEAKKEAKKDKTRRKSGIQDEDVEMEDADADASGDKKAKAGSKKRKKDDDSDGEAPKKTPKTTKLTVKAPKAPKEDSEKPKKATKSKKKAKASSEDDGTPTAEEPAITPAEAKKKKQTSVLYLRHKLQKGFLTRDQPPKEDEMETMHGHFTQLEGYPELEADIMRETKIHKVLKAILKLELIPRESEFHFKDRSVVLLEKWNQTLNAGSAGEGETTTAEVVEASTNGVGYEGKTEEPKSDAAEEAKETKEEIQKDELRTAITDELESDKTKEPTAAEVQAATTESGDVTMSDAKDEKTPETKEAE